MNPQPTTLDLFHNPSQRVQDTVRPFVLRRGIGGHQSAASVTDEWLTPPEIIKALGRFDLDPAAPVQRPWPMADRHFTIDDDGLRKQWEGRVWLNPPYDSNIGVWMGKLAAHGDGIALVFARTETQWFVSEVWHKADGILFIHGRLYFHYVTGARASANSGAPSCLVAYGADNVTALRQSGIAGTTVTWDPQNKAVDACLADQVDALNAAGRLTRSCCCGHGKGGGAIILHDGTTIPVANVTEHRI